MRALFSPSVRGRAAESGRESLTHHLELELVNTPLQPWLHSFAALRLKTAITACAGTWIRIELHRPPVRY
jgi:hypothetical protein